MNALQMIERLKTVGISFDAGMSNEDIASAESAFHFRFPKEIREFLSCAVPVSGSFFNYRDLSEENPTRFLQS